MHKLVPVFCIRVIFLSLSLSPASLTSYRSFSFPHTSSISARFFISISLSALFQCTTGVDKNQEHPVIHILHVARNLFLNGNVHAEL